MISPTVNKCEDTTEKMSWWDSSTFSSFASQALKNAQKKIDKVLDITDESAGKTQSSKNDPTLDTKKDSSLNISSESTSDQDEEDTQMSWSMPWGIDTSFSKPSKHDSKQAADKKSSKGSNLKQKTDLTEKKGNVKEEPLQKVKSKQKLSLDELLSESSEEGKDREKAALKLVTENLDESKCHDESSVSHGNVNTEKDILEDTGQDNKNKEKSEDYKQELSTLSANTFHSPADHCAISVEDGKIEHSETNDADETSKEKSFDTATHYTGCSDSKDVYMTQNEEVSVQTDTRSCDRTCSDMSINDSAIPIGISEEEENSAITLEISKEESERMDSIEGRLSERNEKVTNFTDGSIESENVLQNISYSDKTSGEVDTSHGSSAIDIKTSNSLSESNVIDSVESSDLDLNKLSGLPLSPSTASSLGGTDSDTNKLDSSLDTYTSDDTVVSKSGEDPASNKEGLSEDTLEDDNTLKEKKESTQRDAGRSEMKNSSSESSSPSSSYVKCMIEEAMDDNASDTPSNGWEKSECSRSTGGHDSGDEISTTTSSDIEIISTPTPNGDGNKIVDLSPLRIALQKTASRGSLSHKRTDSQSTSSSRDGQYEQLSPGREAQDPMIEDENYIQERKLSQETGQRLIAELPTLSEEKVDNQQQQKLLKLQTVPELCESSLADSHHQNLAEMTEILQARENKLVQLSKENLSLQEDNSILRSQLQHAEEVAEAKLEDLNKVTAEFTQRLSDSEKRVNQVIREKDAIKKQMQRAQEELEKKIKDKSLQNLLQEKDQQITELMQEGEKLSKQQLQVNTIIRKLRVKEKENDSLIASQKKKLEDQNAELDHLRKVCESKDDLEKKQTEAIGQLNAAVQKQEREISKLKSDLEDGQERVRGLQTALDNSYKEIADLNRSNAAQDSKAHEAALSVEMQVREELKHQLEQDRKSYMQEKEALVIQIEDLRLTLSRMEKEHNRKEDMLRQEISDLQRHLHEDEARSQELTQAVTSATRPLLRQIENLQSTYAAQSQTWEKVEKNLSDRLIEAQSQLASAVEKERASTESLMDLKSKAISLETQISCLRQDKTQLTAQLDMLKTKLEVLEDAKNSDVAQLEAVKQEMAQELSDAKKEKMFLEAQLDMEKTKVEQEKKKMAIAQDQIAQLEREAQRPVSRGSQSPLSVSRTESLSGDMTPMFTSLSQEDMDRSFLMSPNTGKTSLYDSLRHSGAATVLENLQSQLKQKEGEIVQLRNDIQQLERTRESMARELVNLTNQIEELQIQVEQLPEYKSKLEEVQNRYNALLQMYGEKVEEADELRMDLQDVKEMYKSQIDHLLTK